jgi:hypothetical protein
MVSLTIFLIMGSISTYNEFCYWICLPAITSLHNSVLIPTQFPVQEFSLSRIPRQIGKRPCFKRILFNNSRGEEVSPKPLLHQLRSRGLHFCYALLLRTQSSSETSAFPDRPVMQVPTSPMVFTYRIDNTAPVLHATAHPCSTKEPRCVPFFRSFT